MANELIDTLKQKFAFDTWATPELRAENVFVWRFDPVNVPLPEWTLDSATILETIEPQPKALREAQAKNDVRAIDSVWTQGSDIERALHVTTYECASREDARAQLLRALTEFQSPIVERATNAPGEIAFQMPKKTMLLFTRGNLVILVRNAGEKVANVVPPAKALDAQLTATPAAMTRGIEVRMAKESVAVGKRVAIALAAADPGATIRIVARGGEVRLEKSQPVYQPHTPGEHEITVVTMRGDQSAVGVTRVRAK